MTDAAWLTTDVDSDVLARAGIGPEAGPTP